MVGRQTLIDEWRMKLAEWHDRLELSSRRPWLARLYVRLYTYLVERYGQDEGTPVPTVPADEESSMPFFAAKPIEGGRPPRSADHIRAVLDAVHENIPARAEAGPLAAGLPPDSLIAVAAFYDPREVRRLRSTLKKVDIESETQRLRKQTQVLVRVADMYRSRPIVDSFLAFKSRDSSAKRGRLGRIWGVVGGAIGFFIGIVLAMAFNWVPIFDPPNDPLFIAFLLVLLPAAIGAALGLIIGTIADG